MNDTPSKKDMTRRIPVTGLAEIRGPQPIVTKLPVPDDCFSLRNLDRETIQILIDDKIATGG